MNQKRPNDETEAESSIELIRHDFYYARRHAIYKHIPAEFVNFIDDFFGSKSAEKALLITFFILIGKNLNNNQRVNLHALLISMAQLYREFPPHFLQYVENAYQKRIQKGLFILHVLHIAHQLQPENRHTFLETYLNQKYINAYLIR